jgi:HAD superfamily hydrolase (TIGR01509 family)
VELAEAQFLTILELLKEQNFRPSAGLLPLLDRLVELGIGRAMFSSSDRFYVEAVLRFFNIERFFPVVVGGDEVARRKPFPDGYLKAVELSGGDPARTIAVEDSSSGVKSAKAAGLRVIGYRNPTSGGQDVSGADFVVDSLEEVLPMLAKTK